jgi:hypothetical protein
MLRQVTEFQRIPNIVSNFVAFFASSVFSPLRLALLSCAGKLKKGKRKSSKHRAPRSGARIIHPKGRSWIFL